MKTEEILLRIASELADPGNRNISDLVTELENIQSDVNEDLKPLIRQLGKRILEMRGGTNFSALAQAIAKHDDDELERIKELVNTENPQISDLVHAIEFLKAYIEQNKDNIHAKDLLKKIEGICHKQIPIELEAIEFEAVKGLETLSSIEDAISRLKNLTIAAKDFSSEKFYSLRKMLIGIRETHRHTIEEKIIKPNANVVELDNLLAEVEEYENRYAQHDEYWSNLARRIQEMLLNIRTLNEERQKDILRARKALEKTEIRYEVLAEIKSSLESWLNNKSIFPSQYLFDIYSEIISAFQKSAQSECQSRLMQAKEFYKLGELQKALATYKEANHFDPENEAAAEQIDLIYSIIENGVSVDIAPRNISELYFNAEKAFINGEIEEALNIAKRIDSWLANNQLFWHEFRNLNDQIKKKDRTQKIISQADKKFEDGNWEEALRLYKEASSLAPEDWNTNLESRINKVSLIQKDFSDAKKVAETSDIGKQEYALSAISSHPAAQDNPEIANARADLEAKITSYWRRLAGFFLGFFGAVVILFVLFSAFTGNPIGFLISMILATIGLIFMAYHLNKAAASL